MQSLYQSQSLPKVYIYSLYEIIDVRGKKTQPPSTSLKKSLKPLGLEFID